MITKNNSKEINDYVDQALQVEEQKTGEGITMLDRLFQTGQVDRDAYVLMMEMFSKTMMENMLRGRIK